MDLPENLYIHDVTRATLIARVICCPGLVGFLTLAESDRIESVIKKANFTIVYPATSLMSLALSMLLKLTYSFPFCLIHTVFFYTDYIPREKNYSL